MYPVLFHLGPITLHTYGLMVALGFLAALAALRHEFDREGLPIYLLDRLALTLMLSGLLGARLLYFGVNGFDELRQDPLSFFRIWEGGLVFYGGFIAAAIAAFVFAIRYELPILSLADALAAPLLLGQAIGRIGCFAAGCCYGKPTTSFLGVIFTHPESLALKFTKIHPTQLYSSAGEFLLFAAALFIGKRNPVQGVITAFYLLGYGIFRFIIEFLRGDDRGVFLNGFSPSQWLSLVMVAAGIGLSVYVKRNDRI